jgi:hypothetical protein
MPSFDSPDGEQLNQLLEQQHGMISAGQLTAAGVARSYAHERVLARRWQRPHYGVYAAFSGPLSRTATIWAALLRCGPTAVASHQTAAELDGLSELEDERVHVTVAVTHRVYGRPSGIRVHYAHRLPRTRHPAKSPPRTRLDETVLDLVDSARSPREAARWIVAAIQRRLTDPSHVAVALALRKKIKWRAMAESMLLDASDGAHSMLEVEHLRRVERAHRLPTGTRQRRIAGRRVIWIDVDYVEYATRVELDGRVGHQEDGAFRDRRRDNDGVVGGQATLRYGHPEVFGSPCDIAAEQAVVLQDRGWPGEPRPCGSECHLTEAMKVIRADRDAA